MPGCENGLFSQWHGSSVREKCSSGCFRGAARAACFGVFLHLHRYAEQISTVMAPHPIGFTLGVMYISTARQRPFLSSFFFHLVSSLSHSLASSSLLALNVTFTAGDIFRKVLPENRFLSPRYNTLKQYLFLRWNTRRISCNMITMSWCLF